MSEQEILKRIESRVEAIEATLRAELAAERAKRAETEARLAIANERIDDLDRQLREKAFDSVDVMMDELGLTSEPTMSDAESPTRLSLR